MKATVSIAMATFNGGRFIAEQLDSFVDQEWLPSELVACDDGSSDDTLAILERFAARAPFRVKVERNPERLSYTPNFEKALSLCTGDLVFISDQDDKWYGPKISTIVGLLAENPTMMVAINDQSIWDGGDSYPGSTVLSNVRKLGYPDEYFGTGACTAIRKEFLQILFPFPPGIAYDEWINRMAYTLETRLLCETSLQAYRRHDANTSHALVSRSAPTRWDVLTHYGLDDPRGKWRQERETIACCRERITKYRTLLEDLIGGEAVENALAALDRRSARFADRLAILKRGRVARFPLILQSLSRGLYDDFAGVKSAFKDIIRP